MNSPTKGPTSGRSGVCSDLPAGLKDYRDYLAALRSVLALSDTPELRARLVKWLVARVELLPQSFKIHYFVGKSVIVPVDWDPSADKAHVGPDASSAPSLPIRMVGGSNTLTNGAGDGARTRHLQLGKLSLYQMSYSRIES